MVHLTVPLTRADEGTEYAGVYATVFLIPRRALGEIIDRERNANRIVYRIDGGPPIHVGMMHDGKGDYFITVNKDLQKRYAIEVGDEVALTIEPDDSEYGMPVPEEVTELWNLDPEARRIFHTLSPGHQRNLLYQIDKLKRPETRAKRTVQFHEYLKAVNGNLDYRELNAYLKADNRS